MQGFCAYDWVNMIKFFNRTKKTTNQVDRRLLFVSHEATRTGAPKIILNLLKRFHERCSVECESILISGGSLVSEFAQHSIVDCYNLSTETSDTLKSRCQQSVFRDRRNLPVLAICNSMESRFVSQELFNLGIPVVSLIHELPSSYSETDYQRLYQISQKVVFPCNWVRDQTDAKTSIPFGKTMVLSQGLLDPDFGNRIERNVARRQIREELELAPDSQLVLGCGTLDLRKGIDHFANIARRYLEEKQAKTPVHFIWVGGGPRWKHSAYHYVQIDLENSSVQSRVHFIGERENVAPYFLGADLFLLTSRVDPFPCVIHEAMACRLPIIAFDKSGGAIEAISEGAGFPIRYGDYDQAANLIRLLLDQPEIADGVRERAVERVHSRFQFDHYADRLIELCESILGDSLRLDVGRKIVPLQGSRQAA